MSSQNKRPSASVDGYGAGNLTGRCLCIRGRTGRFLQATVICVCVKERKSVLPKSTGEIAQEVARMSCDSSGSRGPRAAGLRCGYQGFQLLPTGPGTEYVTIAPIELIAQCPACDQKYRIRWEGQVRLRVNGPAVNTRCRKST